MSSDPQTFRLQQNSPNPFNSSAEISFHLPRAQEIDLSVFELSGQRVATVSHGHRAAGPHVLQWSARGDDGGALSSGEYLYRLKTERGATRARRMILLK